jgi:hypothetical protein
VPFDIGPDVYKKLKYDALAFFYLQRSGIDIKMPYAGSKAYERPAGHVGDKSVPCSPEAKCNYKLDVSGGWYDAGDHGKYLVNGGFSVWALQNQYEMLTVQAHVGDFADGKMSSRGRTARPARQALRPGRCSAAVPRTAQRRHGTRRCTATSGRRSGDAAQGRHQALPAPGQRSGDTEPGRAGWAARVAKLDPAFSALPAAAETAYATAKKNRIAAGPKVGAAASGDATSRQATGPRRAVHHHQQAKYKDDLKSRATPRRRRDRRQLGWDHMAPPKLSRSPPPWPRRPEIAAARDSGTADRFLG